MLSIEAEIFLDLHKSSHPPQTHSIANDDSRQIWIRINYF